MKTKYLKKVRTSRQLSPLVVTPSRMGGAESKIATLNSVWNSVSTAGSFVPLVSNIAAGVDSNARIGRRIRVFRVAFQGTALGGQTNSVADDPYNVMRIVIISCVPGFTWSSGITVNSWLDPRYHAGLFEVLHDQNILLRTSAKDSTGYIPAAKIVQINISCNTTLEYNSTSAAAPVGRELRAYCVSDSMAIAHPGFSADSSFVLEFFDS